MHAEHRTIASTGIGNPRHASCLRTCRATDSRTVKRDVGAQRKQLDAGGGEGIFKVYTGDIHDCDCPEVG